MYDQNGNATERQRLAIASARRTFAVEQQGIGALADALEGPLAKPFADALGLVLAATGRVIVTGMGKSGHVGTKIAATLSSTGTPAFFVHPGEASHGDLGMITPADVIVALSWSGETAELRNIVDYSRRFGVSLISITSNADSTLGRASDVVLALPKVQEACPHGLAPTTSSTLQLVLGDALSVALLELKGFTAGDFKVFHPGGQLGAYLKFVRDVMHTGSAVPLVPEGTAMSEAIVVMTGKGFGCLGIVGADGALSGIITDGDLRRHIGDDLLARRVEEVMTPKPKTVRPDALVSEAMQMLNAAKITALLVAAEGRPVGIVHFHDLLRIGAA
ncbi:MAG TPA: KpsF/GutQ family sugar-phosphate isomerase [Kaistiaceae bacterium]|nr:KpsF/GutQ family sugar-phosphate isomerase [Kaistiaceae bacterium]